MIVDTSVLVAILKEEDDARHFATRLVDAKGELKLSAGSLIEVATVTIRYGTEQDLDRLDQLVDHLAMEVIAVDRLQASIARHGYALFGRGSGKVVALNFGDCFAYALAKATGEPLLFKGDDFTKTDIVAA